MIFSLSILRINGLIHNTGGGFLDNVPRILPAGCKAVINPDSWDIPPVFNFLKEKGNISDLEMFRTFNMGIGMIALVDEDIVEDAMLQFNALGETPFVIGEITRGDKKNPSQQVELPGITNP